MVSVHYDPLLAKLIAAGRDRAEALERLADALGRYRIEGVKTTVPLHRRILASPAFRAGAVHTRFLEGGLSDRWLKTCAPTSRAWCSRSSPARASKVAAGDPILILESMKMEIPVEAPRAGVVREIRVAEGQTVQEGEVVATLD